MDEPVYREFRYIVQVLDSGFESDAVEVISLLTQVMGSYKESLSVKERDAIASWFFKKYAKGLNSST